MMGAFILDFENKFFIFLILKNTFFCFQLFNISGKRRQCQHFVNVRAKAVT